MAGSQLTEVDFQQIKNNLVEYLKSTGKYTDYDFDGSNLSVILNLISYQAQLNSYAANMIANESFLSSSSIRSNTVSNARMLGYLPTSQRCALLEVDLEFQLGDEYSNDYPKYVEIRPGMCFSTNSGKESFTFNVIETQVAAVSSAGTCKFNRLKCYEGFYTSLNFTVDTTDFNQRFIIENKFIDTTTIRVEVQEDSNVELNTRYLPATNLVELNQNSTVYWIEEVGDGYYQLTFGDGYFGKALQNGAKIFVNYIISNGSLANGVRGVNNFRYIGQSYDSRGGRVRTNPTILNSPTSDGGSELEDVSSIKFRAPKYYGAQNRCVIASDYEALIRQIYPAVEDIYVYGGETLPIPEYGRVYVIIKPISGNKLSNTTKNVIKTALDNYRIASLDIVLEDPSILFVEVASFVYYDNRRTTKDANSITTKVNEVLSNYASSPTVSKFAGTARYSRIVSAIDDADISIIRNNTTLRMRRDLETVINTRATYKICFVNAILENCSAFSVWSTGFQLELDGILDNRTYYFQDDGKGNIQLYYYDQFGLKLITDTNFGTVDYDRGEVFLGYDNPITIVNTKIPGNIIEIRAQQRDQDIVASHKIYLKMDIAKSDIESIVDMEIMP